VTYARRDELNVAQDPFYGEIIGALEHEIRTGGYFMMLYTSADVDESLRMAASWNVEGLIVLGSLADDCARFMQSADIPLVFIDSYFHADGLPYVNVGLEDRRGGYLMTSHLIEQGHRRIAFLADGDPPMGVDYERLCGYQEALAEHGLPFHKSDYIPISHKYAQRHTFLTGFVKQGDIQKYTALFFASDFYAVDAMNVFHDMGLRVPADISVCGFDGNIFSAQCRPLLTTVQQQVSQKAVHAAAQLFHLIAREPTQSVRLDVSLIPGNSVQHIPSK
jgi:LacI family transcriptional regulator